MRRREFITLLAGAAASPLSVGAQQQPMPVIGYLGAASAEASPQTVSRIRRTLAEAGYVDGRNVAIEFRWAEGQYDRLPELAAELVRRPVTVIVAIPGPAARAARAATTTIPIVFLVDDDPVKLGLVESLARPAGNATGVNFFIAEMGGKQLALMRELVPHAVRIGLLVNPNNANAEAVIGNVTAASSAAGIEINVVKARDSSEIEAGFAALARHRTAAVVVGADPFFYARRVQLVTLATRHAIPTIYNVREFAEAGGLMSYGTSLAEAHHQPGRLRCPYSQGRQTGRPAGRPVDQVRTGD